jgi:CubicO group peptidase (beta-lactamase class C family)
VETIELVPFTSDAMGLRGLVPAGWDEVAPGVYARGQGQADLVRLIQQAAPGMSTEQLAELLLAQLGLDALPESSGRIDTATFDWDTYQVVVEAPGVGTVVVDLALTETDAAAYIVLLQASPGEHEVLREAVFLPAVEALARAEEAGEGEEALYTHPEGLFTVPIPTNWTAEQHEGYATLASPDGQVRVHVLAVEAQDLVRGIRDAWAIVDPEFDLRRDEVLDEPNVTGVERTVTVSYDTGDDETLAVAGAWLHEGVAYVELILADLVAIQKRAAQVQIISTGYTIAALAQEDLSDVEPLPLTDDLLAEWEATLLDTMEWLDVPGAAVAIVQHGEVVYAEGFGVRDWETGEPVTPETMMMTGSSGKSLTTLLMARLVDEGAFAWDTRVVEVLPTFRVADPDVTSEITMRNLVCACSGVPRRDFEWMFNASELSAEDVVESLAEFEFFTNFGEAFQYSNQMVATGGYLAALAGGGTYGDLYAEYAALMQAKVFDPMGMTHTTFSFEEVEAGGAYATPYGRTPTGDLVPLSLDDERVLMPMGPAGALWSNVLDLAKYLITDLSGGVAPDGTRVVTGENLAVTWEPQVQITADASYGLGWIVEDYHGLLVVSHGGNTFGYTSELALVPDAGLGISILSNQQNSLLNQTARYRLLELVYQREPEIGATLEFQMELIEEALAELRGSLQVRVDPEKVEPYLGTYTHTALGDVELGWQNDALVLDVGEFQAEIRSRWSEGGGTSYLTFTPPLAGVPLELKEDEAGRPVMVLGAGVAEYTFEKVE